MSARHLASFFYPKYKDLDHEVSQIKKKIRYHVKELLVEINVSDNIIMRKQSTEKNFQCPLEFPYGDKIDNINDSTIQYQHYLTEPQIRP